MRGRGGGRPREPPSPGRASASRGSGWRQAARLRRLSAVSWYAPARAIADAWRSHGRVASHGVGTVHSGRRPDRRRTRAARTPSRPRRSRPGIAMPRPARTRRREAMRRDPDRGQAGGQHRGHDHELPRHEERGQGHERRQRGHRLDRARGRRPSRRHLGDDEEGPRGRDKREDDRPREVVPRPGARSARDRSPRWTTGPVIGQMRLLCSPGSTPTHLAPGRRPYPVTRDRAVRPQPPCAPPSSSGGPSCAPNWPSASRRRAR